jgi:uncharacterized protein
MTYPRQRDRRVFVDTAAFYALVDRGDTEHEAALAIQNQLVVERWRLYTSNYIVAETHALTLNRLGRFVAARVLDDLERSAESGDLSIIRVSVADERRARDIIRQYSDKDFSLADASSFVVMERLGISQAFSFDRHFEQYGFTVLS